MSTDLMTQKTLNLKSLMAKANEDIRMALPKHLTADRMSKIALIEFKKNPKLLNCDPASFLGAVMQAASLGLELGSALGQCYLIPYGNDVNFQLGYKGMLSLAMRSGSVSHISARAVHEGDAFEWEFGLNEGLTHKPCTNPGELTHVYCVVHLKNGCKMFDVMTLEEIDRVRKTSKSANNGPWKTHFEEMAKKTVIRRLFKYMPVSIELSTAVAYDEIDEQGKSQGNSDIINASSRPVNPVDQLKQKLQTQAGIPFQEQAEKEAEPSEFDQFQAGAISTEDPKVVK